MYFTYVFPTYAGITHYAQNYDGIMGRSLTRNQVQVKHVYVAVRGIERKQSSYFESFKVKGRCPTTLTEFTMLHLSCEVIM